MYVEGEGRRGKERARERGGGKTRGAEFTTRPPAGAIAHVPYNHIKVSYASGYKPRPD